MTLFTSLLPVQVGKTDYPMHPEQPFVVDNRTAFNNSKPTWSLLDGPPYANGKLHLGHVRNKLLKDVLARANSALGQDVRWQAGWDCHGLPVERNVEALGFDRSQTQTFLKECRNYAYGQTLGQKEQFNTLGVSCDMENPYRTMDFKQQADTLRVFSRMVQNGSVYRAYKPVSWCHECQSTVANAESEEMSLNSTDLYFFVSFSDGTNACVWTTQAWSLYGHDSLLVNPDADYGLYNLSKNGESKKVWLSQNAFEGLNALNAFEFQYTGDLKQGNAFAGMPYTLPWTKDEHKVYCHSGVSADAGTGWLHASAACSEDDFVMLKSLDHSCDSLDSNLMSPDGSMPCADGQQYWVAHKNVVEQYLQSEPMAFAQKVKRNRDHCWRHKVPLTVRPSAQWYVKLDENVRKRARERVERVKFVPSSGKARLLDGVDTRPDWCLSRQRTWGVPLCVYADAQGNLAPFAFDEMNRFAQLMETDGTVAALKFPKEKEGYTLCTDVLDVWFDSGACFLTTTDVTPDVVVEGHDQFRGWFQSALWVSAVLDERLPYRKVVAHGFVLAKQGEKLSKSSGNKSKGGAPEWETVHPDVLRVWAAQGEVGNDKFWNKESYENANGLYLKWRNTLRFLLANMGQDVPSESNLEFYDAEKWTMYQASSYSTKVLELLADGSTERAVDAMHTWCQELSNHSFMMMKDRLYCGNQNERDAVKYVLAYVYSKMKKVLEVFMPCTEMESQPFVPSWVETLKYSDECQSQKEWVTWLELRLELQNKWSALSVKGKGALAWATVEKKAYPSRLSKMETLQWLGCSDFKVDESEEMVVSVMDGEQCERCRMVSYGECVFCTERNQC